MILLNGSAWYTYYFQGFRYLKKVKKYLFQFQPIFIFSFIFQAETEGEDTTALFIDLISKKYGLQIPYSDIGQSHRLREKIIAEFLQR